jgi:hypothetical protein
VALPTAKVKTNAASTADSARRWRLVDDIFDGA